MLVFFLKKSLSTCPILYYETCMYECIFEYYSALGPILERCNLGAVQASKYRKKNITLDKKKYVNGFLDISITWFV